MPVSEATTRAALMPAADPRPLRVGYVLKRYPRYSETFVVTEILAHEAAGGEVHIFALGNPMEPHFQDAISRVRAPVRYLAGDGARVADFWSAIAKTADKMPGLWERLPFARAEVGRDVYQAVMLADAVREQGIEHLHAHFASSAASVARLAAHFAGVPFTITAHAKDIFHDDVCPDDLGRKVADAAAVVTVSDYNAAHLRAAHPGAADRIVRIYNGMDLEQLPFTSPAQRPPVVAAVGRLVEKKGFADLIEACALLAGRGRTLTCRIAGTGEQEQQLRGQIERLGIGDHVELLGARPQCEVFNLIRSASVLAAPCVIGADGNRDGLPTVLLEAMALGTPCVSTDLTGIPEAVRDGQTGLIVAQRSPAALADALNRLLSEPELRVRLATQARGLVEREFDVRRNAARLREIFQTARVSAGGRR